MTTPQRLASFLLPAAVAAGAFLAPPSPALAEPAAEQVEAERDPERYVRFRSTPDGGYLETSVLTFRNDEGVSVDLIGAVHVGDPVYYDLLNERFATYDKLLYEMVKPAGADVADRDRAAEETPLAMSLIGTLQRAMQTVLELEYQTEAVDYAPANFVHADMDLETFLRMQAEAGEGFLEVFLRQMLRDLTDPQAAAEAQPQVSMFELMDALNAPDRARRLKLLFARELASMDDMMNLFDPGGDGSVILDRRNERAIEVLDEQLEAGVKDIGVFYGAAHLKGLERLLLDRGFEPVGRPEYLIAWDMTIDGSGRRDMRERMRNAIVRNAIGEAGGDAPQARPGAAAGDGLADLKAEMEAIRRENEALRRQLDALREQNDALRRRAEGD